MLRQQQIQRLVQYQLDGKIHVDKVMRTARYNINLINRKKQFQHHSNWKNPVQLLRDKNQISLHPFRYRKRGGKLFLHPRI